ncbi:MAG: chemotaxis protein CheA [Desulfobacterium sp.]|nr:chemotaxis protein CheA [Desulfobacterium sp.]
MEQLSCDFIMANPGEDPQSVSCLLPLLKQIHTQCVELSLTDNAKEVLRARRLVQEMLKQETPGGLEKKMGAFSDFISDFSIPVEEPASSSRAPLCENCSRQDPSAQDPWDRILSDGEIPMEDDGEESLEKEHKAFVHMTRGLESFTLLLGGVCPEESLDFGGMLEIFDGLIKVSKDIEPDTFYLVSIDCKGYVEKMQSDHNHNTKPLEEALILLNSILSHLKRGEPFTFDYEDVLGLLDFHSGEGQSCNSDIPAPGPSTPDLSAEDTPLTNLPAEPQPLSDDDIEILVDFVSEADENLDTIEVNLMDLEQDPSNRDILNDIFRPFHTIKGVSGFLSLKKINQLAHATENLLDGARGGEFLINQEVTDVILESVDTLKQLIARVRAGVQNRQPQQDQDIDIDALCNRIEAFQASLATDGREPLGQILIKKGVLDLQGLEQSLKSQQSTPSKKLGEILVEEQRATADQVTSALMDQRGGGKRIDTQVKVSTQKLDDLVNYAGELVIAQSMLRQKTAHDPTLSQNVVHLGQIVTNMQNIAMSMRMIPIKATFMKMIRLVRDLAHRSGKEVALTMEGEDTEIDRNVVDALYEPMVHMIRNSVDHGIEACNERIQLQKPLKGNIILRAYHKGGYILIEIEDDGKGLDRDRILQKAISSGVVPEGATLTDGQVYDLIMAPGFSTAEEITDVSGRGVGMDVVKDGIEKFRGQLNIDSSKGKGTKFTISLPLTLAVIDGMLILVDGERYVVPTISIQRAFKPAREECFTVQGQGEMVKDRGSLIPLIRLNDLYNAGLPEKPVWDCLVVVVESKDEKRALLIDELLGKDEYVIKNLGKNFEGIKGLAGGAILADGRVGLILDIHGIFTLASKK